MLLSGSTQVYAFIGVFFASGFVLYILAHGGFEADESNFGD